MGLGEIAAVSGLDKSTVQRVTHTLHRLGYLEKSAETRRFSLGKKLLDDTSIVATLVGRRMPTFCSSGGRAMMAHLPVERAIVDPDAIYAKVEEARRNGFAPLAIETARALHRPQPRHP